LIPQSSLEVIDMRKASSHSFAGAVITLSTCCLLILSFAAHATTGESAKSAQQARFSCDPEGAGILPRIGQSKPSAGCSPRVSTHKVGIGIGTQRQISGGSEGGGILPYTGVPELPMGRVDVVTTPTAGFVIDGQRLPIAGTLVVVTHPALGVVAHTFTGADGHFVVDLPEFAHLELAVPDAAIAGIDVRAGFPVIILAR